MKRSRNFLLTGIGAALLLLVAGCGNSSNAHAPAPVALPGSDISTLPLLTDEQTRSITAENPNGAKGGAAREVPDTNEPSPPGAATGPIKLGQGWKVRPFIRVNAGQTVTLMDVDGPGVIRHILMSEGLSRDHVLRIYWDGETSPSVEVPVPDFFAVGHEIFAPVNSQVIIDNPENALNCYWPMPFKHHAWITLANEGRHDLYSVAFQIDYVLRSVPGDAGYFHAQWRRANTARENPYVILDGVRGRGKYVGTFLALTQLHKGWFGEGQVKFYLDGDTKFPTICGTGTEDYFGSTYGFHAPYSTLYCGETLPADTGHEPPNYWSLYRWHIADPISFSQDIKVTLPTVGWDGDNYKKVADDIASVAYWYQTEPHAPFPPLLPPSERAPIKSANTRLPEPPPGFLFDPRNAMVSDTAGNNFTWHDACENNIGGDHFVFGGWQAIGNYRDYLAYGQGLVQRNLRYGLIMQANPGTNTLFAQWPVEASPGQKLHILCTLTDGSWKNGGNGVALRLDSVGRDGTNTVLNETLKPGRKRIIDISKALSGGETKLRLQLDNLDGEKTDTVWTSGSLE